MPVDGKRISVHRIASHRQAVAEPADHRFGGVRQGFQPRQAEETAGSLDGVNEAKNIAEDLGVVRLLLETHQFQRRPRRGFRWSR